MLALSDAQLQRIEQLERARLSGAMAPVLAVLWPAAAEKLAERWPAFVTAATERASTHGIDSGVDQARFVALCSLWGASFETRPGFEWAADILADPRRSGPLKLYQLLARARSELPLTGPLSRSAFELALLKSDATLAALSRVARVFADTAEPAPLAACDLGTVALGLSHKPPLTLTDAPEAPLELAVLAPTSFKLATQPLSPCREHPQLRHECPAGRLHWRGLDAHRIALTLPAPVEQEPGLTGIAHSPAPETHRFSLSSCGVRDTGAPFGALEIAVQAYPRTAWRCLLQHGAWPAAHWPEPGTALPATVRLQLEADATELDTTPWRQQWLALQGQWRAGLEKLFNAWANGLEAPKLEAEAALLMGEAQLTWGNRETSDGIAMHTAGRIDLTAINLDLRLSGQLRAGDTEAELRVQAIGRTAWQQDVTPEDDLEQVVCAWRHPLQLTLLPRITANPALLAARPGAPCHLTGKSGLRPRPDGRGWQWFYKIELEALSLSLATHDPLLGERREPRTLVPAMTLLDWSAG